jgi:hypothetical protein
MGMVSERIRGTFSNARNQIEHAKVQLEDFEKTFEKKVGELERKAKESLDDVPAQLKGAWETVVGRVRTALDFATREELKALANHVEVLAQKVERLIRGEKIRDRAKDRPGAKTA